MVFITDSSLLNCLTSLRFFSVLRISCLMASIFCRRASISSSLSRSWRDRRCLEERRSAILSDSSENSCRASFLWEWASFSSFVWLLRRSRESASCCSHRGGHGQDNWSMEVCTRSDLIINFCGSYCWLWIFISWVMNHMIRRVMWLTVDSVVPCGRRLSLVSGSSPASQGPSVWRRSSRSPALVWPPLPTGAPAYQSLPIRGERGLLTWRVLNMTQH